MVALADASELWTGSLLLVDKPETWTSFDAVAKIRNALKLPGKKIKVGHAGTLDPLATGLLLICTGKGTKMIQDLTGLDKRYTGTIRLGATTASYDRETPEEPSGDPSGITRDNLEGTAAGFTGPIGQVPPAHSAIKVDGKRAYKLARSGKDVEMAERRVEIHSFRIIEVNLPDVGFEVHCSKGTYIRSLAHDFGKALGVGGYLYSLRRTAIGPHRIEDAWNLEELIAYIRAEKPGYLDKLAADGKSS